MYKLHCARLSWPSGHGIESRSFRCEKRRLDLLFGEGSFSLSISTVIVYLYFQDFHLVCDRRTICFVFSPSLTTGGLFNLNNLPVATSQQSDQLSK